MISRERPARGNREAPARRIAHAARRARPVLEGLERHVLARERPRAAVGGDERARAVRVGGAVAPAQPVDHQVAPVVELEREPVPAGEVGAERARPPLAVHPGEPGDRERCRAHPHRAARGHAGERVVVRRIARLRPLRAQPAIALEHDAACRARGRGRWRRRRPRPAGASGIASAASPSADQSSIQTRNGRARAPARSSASRLSRLAAREAPARGVGQREVRQVELGRRPGRARAAGAPRRAAPARSGRT